MTPSKQPSRSEPDLDVSQFMSMCLRHGLVSMGFDHDAQGWVSVAQLLEKGAGQPFSFTHADVVRVVEQSKKQRFALSEDELYIRANQGHSAPVDLGLADAVPPEGLFHGTTRSALPSILAQGLTAQGRHAVHLSHDVATANRVGSRHVGEEVVVLHVNSMAMARSGHTFQRSSNGVWLTAHVPPEFLTVSGA